MSALLTEGLGNGTFNGSPQLVLLEGLTSAEVTLAGTSAWWYVHLTGDLPGDAAFADERRFSPYEFWRADSGFTYKAGGTCPDQWTGLQAGIVLQHYSTSSPSVVGDAVVDSPSEIWNSKDALNMGETGTTEHFRAQNTAADWRFLHDATTDWTIAMPLYFDAAVAGTGVVVDSSRDGTGGPGLRWVSGGNRFFIWVYSAAFTSRVALFGTVGDVPYDTPLVCVLSYNRTVNRLRLRINGTETTSTLTGTASSSDPPQTLWLADDAARAGINTPLLFIAKSEYNGSDLTDLEAFINAIYLGS